MIHAALLITGKMLVLKKKKRHQKGMKDFQSPGFHLFIFFCSFVPSHGNKCAQCEQAACSEELLTLARCLAQSCNQYQVIFGGFSANVDS